MTTDLPDDSFAALFEKAGSAVPRRGGARVGETLSVNVVHVGKDAVFVELDGHRQGFIEAGSLRGQDGTLKVAVGDRLRARVSRVDAENGIELVPTVEAAVAAGASVSIGQAGSPAAATAADVVKIALGQVVSGSVDRVESYGIFVQIDGTRGRGGRGLVPTVELGVPRATDLRKAFPIATKIKAKVVEIAEGRMRLSVRALKDDEERAQFDGFREQKQKAAAPQTLGTLGDLLKKRTPR
ncbi:MAG: S1 RNA-binding domain-containing protein [Polyangiaceae bacterium]|jgi:ribosomal protein S1